MIIQVTMLAHLLDLTSQSFSLEKFHPKEN